MILSKTKRRWPHYDRVNCPEWRTFPATILFRVGIPHGLTWTERRRRRLGRRFLSLLPHFHPVCFALPPSRKTNRFIFYSLGKRWSDTCGGGRPGPSLPLLSCSSSSLSDPVNVRDLKLNLCSPHTHSLDGTVILDYELLVLCVCVWFIRNC